MGRPKLSLNALNEALNISKNADWGIQYNLGLCYTSLNDLPKAKEHFWQAVQCSRQENSFLALAGVNILENDIPRAVEVYYAALELSPESVDLSTSLGLLYMKMGDNQKALEHFGSALAHNPDCIKALMGTALVMQVF